MNLRFVIMLLALPVGLSVGATAGLSGSVESGQASTSPVAGRPSQPQRDAPVVDPAVSEAQDRRADVIERAKRSVVAVFSSTGRGGGSGVVISPDGLALTNFHVVKPSGCWMKCGMANGRIYDAVLVGLDPTGDIALIQLLGRNDFPAATLGDSDAAAVGDWVYAMGNPFLLATDLEPTVTYGIVSGVHRYQYPAGTLLEYTDCLQTDAAINPGNSGGPLFDAAGRLVGINGRCSFEKRGRVSVGVGYAVSINQTKNFLGCLASGRIVDHATLGFRAAFDADGRVVVDEIQDSSDAFRRGLRYGDEIVEFAGRAIDSPNALKNVVGTFPEGWRLPLVYRRSGQRREILVRLAPLHHESRLLAEMQGPRVVKKPKSPDAPKKGPTQKPSPGGPPKPEPGKLPALAPRFHAIPPAPAVVKSHYAQRRGYTNYFFNRRNQERVWRAWMLSSGEHDWAGRWTIAGAIASGKPFRIELDDAGARIELPAGRTEWTAGDNLAGDLAPPGSGGLLPALYLWRRLATTGLDHFGEVHYWGSAPMDGRSQMVDVLVGTYGGVECRFCFEPGQSRLVALEMFPDDGVDPCEVCFSDYRALGRQLVPGTMEVRFGNEVYGRFAIETLVVERDDPSRVEDSSRDREGAVAFPPRPPRSLTVAARNGLAAQSWWGDVLSDLQPKMVKIFGAGGYRGLEPYQSGFLISAEGHVLTAWSYVLDTDAPLVVLHDGRRFEARLVGADPRLEIAVLKIDAQGLAHFDLARAVDVPAGTRILALANLFGVAAGNEPVSVQHGVVSVKTTLAARRGVFDTPYHGPVYVVDARTSNPGAAGGALVTQDGRLVGVLGKELRNAADGTWLNYAVPIEAVRLTVEQIVAGNHVVEEEKPETKPSRPLSPAELGLIMVPEALPRTPAYIDAVRPDTPAARAGLRPDDLVVLVNGRLIQSCQMLREELRRLAHDATVRASVMRDGQLVEFTLEAAKP